MAPLTRYRASDAHIPLPMIATYYAQRGCIPGTLLISEATFISPRASGYKNVPGIWNAAQIAAWKDVTAAVHAKGSYIYCQLWALGRAAAQETLRQEFGMDVVSSSAVGMGEGHVAPRALREDEIFEFIGDYAQAARNAIAAGFDGVEIHGANGYLVDQFTQDKVNQRTDAWGSSVEKRSRFALEVAKAVVDAVGKERVGIRLSPWSKFQGMGMEDPVPQFSHLVRGLKVLDLAYLHLVESRISGNADVEVTNKIDFAVDIWTKGEGKATPVFVAGGFRPDSARRAVDEEYRGKDVCVVFGRYFISNPDLVFRVKEGIEFTKYDRSTFYKAKSEDGYIDCKFSKEWDAGISKFKL